METGRAETPAAHLLHAGSRARRAPGWRGRVAGAAARLPAALPYMVLGMLFDAEAEDYKKEVTAWTPDDVGFAKRAGGHEVVLRPQVQDPRVEPRRWPAFFTTLMTEVLGGQTVKAETSYMISFPAKEINPKHSIMTWLKK